MLDYEKKRSQRISLPALVKCTTPLRILSSVNLFSWRQMRSTRAELVQTVKFHASGKTISTHKIVASVTGEGCGPRGWTSWNNQPLQVRKQNQTKLSTFN